MRLALLVNGVAPSDPSQALAANDRGFHYGDGVFETTLLLDGRVRFLHAHFERLYAGCSRLAIPAPDEKLLRAEIAKVTAGMRTAIVKVIVSRGSGSRGYYPGEASAPTRVVAVYDAPEPSSDAALSLRWCGTRLGRNERLAGIKHLNRLEQVLARAEWNDPNIHEGLMLDTEGELVSATSANVFLVRDSALHTPDLRYCGVRGVLRQQVLRAAETLGIATSEEPLWPQDLESAQEVFITNAVRGLRSVARLDSLQWTQTSVAAQIKEALSL